MLKACIGLNCARQIDFIDRHSCQLDDIPEEIYRHEATLEELILDSNAIQELPPKFFRMVNLRKITLSENEIMRLSPMIGNFTKLVELDLSKNCLEELPSNIQFCRSLSILDISANPLLRIPDCVASISSLTHLYLNDVALPALPREIGNLQNLIVLEARENVMRRIPPSIGDLTKLQRLDLGNNEIEDLPPTFGYLEELQELWLDSNCLSLLPESMSRLRNLKILDVTKNKLERFPNHFANLVNLVDLHASENCIEALPENFGLMKSLVQIKLDLNHLIYLPDSIGKLLNVTEIFLFENMLESIPASIFEIPVLEMLNIDRNHLIDIPKAIGKCKSLHVFSVRENELVTLPEEIGQLESLRVLDVCGNHLMYLPVTVSNLQLDAFWISGDQPQPLISLRQEPNPDNPDKKVLTCPFLPQQGPESMEMDGIDNVSDIDSEEGGFSQRKRNNSLRNSTRLTVAFDPGTSGLPAEEVGGKFVRFPTPFRKELKNKHKKPKLDARPRTTVFKKGSMDDLTVHAVNSSEDVPSSTAAATSQVTTPPDNQNIKQFNGKDHRHLKHLVNEDVNPSPLLKTYGVQNLSEGYLADEAIEMNEASQTEADDTQTSSEPNQIPPRSKLQTVEVTVELTKDPARGGLGFSIAGGKGSTPAYEDVDESIFITRIIRGGPAEKDGRLRLGDKLLSVNGIDMTDASHMEAVTTLRGTPRKCILQISREVLVVLPDGSSYDDGSSLTVASTTNDDILRQSSTESTTPVPVNKETAPISDQATPTPNTHEGVATEAMTGQIVVEAEIYTNDTEGEALVLDDREELCLEEEQMLEEMAEEMFAESEIEDATRDDYVNIEIAQSLLDEAKAYQQEENQQSGSVTPDSNEELVMLDRQHPTLGMSIVGGADYVNKIFGSGKPGIYISKITPGGSAAATGKLRFGDKIVKVNGISMEGLSHDEAVETLIMQEGDIELSIYHEQQPVGLMEVQIDKSNSKKLGISIKGGSPGSHGNPLDPEDEGIFISKITPGEAAEKDGRLVIGHRILEVNGLPLLGATHVEAVHALRNVGDTVTILVCHGYSFDEYLNYAKVLRVQRPFAGSVDALDHNNEKLTLKRTHSSSSADRTNNKLQEGDDDSDVKLDDVLKELVQFNVQMSSTDLLKDTNDSDKPAAEPSEVFAVLDESVQNMDKVTEEADQLVKSSSVSAQRKLSVELTKRRQEGKKEELESFISELSDITTNEHDSIIDNEINNDVRVSLESAALFSGFPLVINEAKGDQEHCPVEKQRSLSCSAPPEIQATDRTNEVVMVTIERPMSADGKRKKEAPPTAPKPIVVSHPETLPFRDRLALFENVTKLNRRENYRSWTPDMFPRSGSVSPVYNKWASYSSLGNSPLHRSEVLLRLDKENIEKLSLPVKPEPANVVESSERNNVVETNESNLSISSDPPLTGSTMSPPLANPLSPPIADDPGISPPPTEDVVSESIVGHNSVQILNDSAIAGRIQDDNDMNNALQFQHSS